MVLFDKQYLCSIDLEKLELFADQFHPLIPNNGCESLKSCSKKFDFMRPGSTKAATSKFFELRLLHFFYNLHQAP
jgi:hypothetical protein